MSPFDYPFDAEAWEMLRASLAQHDGWNGDWQPGKRMPSEPHAFRSRSGQHLPRSYRNGLARFFCLLARQAVFSHAQEQAHFLAPEFGAELERLPSYLELREAAERVLYLWPMDDAERACLVDYGGGESRARALRVRLARMSVRLAPTPQRRLVLAYALHQQKQFERARAQIAHILVRDSGSEAHALAWHALSQFELEEGRGDRAWLASRASAALVGGRPMILLDWLVTSVLAGNRGSLVEAASELTKVADSSHTQVLWFCESRAARYPQEALPIAWFDGLPRVAQRVLWQVFG